MNKKLKTTADIRKIESLLQSVQPEPGSSFYARMKSAPWGSSRVTQPKQPYNKRLIWAGLSIVLILTLALLFTPVGRALANEILHFFVRAPGNTLQLSPAEIVEIIPSGTPLPTYFPTLLPADQVQAPTLQPTQPLNQEIDEQARENLDSTSARSLVNFELSMPSALPKDYRLTNISYNPEQEAIYCVYASPFAGTGEFFSLTQGTNLAPLNVGADAEVDRLQISQREVEWVQGGWFVPIGEDTSVWEEKAPLNTLRWEENGISFELLFSMNESFSPAYLDKEDMQFIVENIRRCAAETSASEKYTCEVQQASAAAGFTPWQFEQVPDGFSFKTVDYQPGLSAIWYSLTDGEIGVFQTTRDFTALETSVWISVPEESVQQVYVGEIPAEYVNGSFTAKPGEEQAVWQQDSGQIRLRWKNGEWWFQIIKWGAPEMRPQELADLATLLSEDPAAVDAGAQDQAQEIKVGDAYLSIKAAEADYGKPILAPALVPEGLPFSHARLITEDMVMLFYGSFAADKMRSNGALLMFTQANSPANLEGYPQEAIEEVSINDLPAKLVSGTLNRVYSETGEELQDPTWIKEPYTISLYWSNSGTFYTLRFYAGWRGDMRLSTESLLQIAESVQ